MSTARQSVLTNTEYPQLKSMLPPLSFPRAYQRPSDASSVCSRCKESFSSSYWRKGQCEQCGDFLCSRCWILGMRTCSRHAGPTAGPISSAHHYPGPFRPSSSRKESPSNCCVECGKEIDRSISSHQTQVLCLDCQRTSIQLPDKLPSNAVTVQDANYREMLFHRFVASGIEDSKTWPGDLALKKLSSLTKSVPNRARSTEQMLTTHPLRDALLERAQELPPNKGVAVTVTYGKGTLWPRRTHKTVELGVYSYVPSEELLERGYIQDPYAGHDLSRALECFGWTAKATNTTLLFSPVGWSDSVSAPKGVVLVSLSLDGRWRLRHDLTDSAMVQFIEALFLVETDEEKADRCVSAELSKSGSEFPLSARAVAEKNGLPADSVAEAFQRLSRRESGWIVCTDTLKEDWLLDNR